MVFGGLGEDVIMWGSGEVLLRSGELMLEEDRITLIGKCVSYFHSETLISNWKTQIIFHCKKQSKNNCLKSKISVKRKYIW